MQSARSLHCAPRQIAQAVVDNLDCASVDKMEIAGPGFINFYLKQNWTADLLAGILAAGETTAICLLTAWVACRLNM